MVLQLVIIEGYLNYFAMFLSVSTCLLKIATIKLNEYVVRLGVPSNNLASLDF